MRILIVFALFATGCASTGDYDLANGFTATATRVPAPGVIEVAVDGDLELYRLADLISPKPGTPGAEDAREALAELVLLKTVRVLPAENFTYPWNWGQEAISAYVVIEETGEDVGALLLQQTKLTDHTMDAAPPVVTDTDY